jgi:hypothetical protein
LAADVKRAYGGIITSLSQQFISEYKNTFNQEFVQQIQQSYYSSIEKNFQVSIFDVLLKMNNIKIEEARYEPQKT